MQQQQLAFYEDESEFWKCAKHPTPGRPRTGVCPICLRQRLAALCPNCAEPLPCSSCHHHHHRSATTATTSSSSSSFSSSSLLLDRSSTDAINHHHSVRDLIKNEPPFRKSRSAAQRSARFFSGRDAKASEEGKKKWSWSWSWSVLLNWGKRGKEEEEEEGTDRSDWSTAVVMERSTSVSMVEGVRFGVGSSSGKSKGWHFPTPLRVFRQYRAVQVRSPPQQRS